MRFQPTPSLRRATVSHGEDGGEILRISTHALLAEGDYVGGEKITGVMPFQPTPSLRRATRRRPARVELGHISTHALLAEGDKSALERCGFAVRFQPTPSLRRATFSRASAASSNRPISTHALLAEGDGEPVTARRRFRISTHALLAEGDSVAPCLSHSTEKFQPTPSLRRATANLNNSTNCYLFKFARFVCSSRHMLSLKFQRYP